MTRTASSFHRTTVQPTRAKQTFGRQQRATIESPTPPPAPAAAPSISTNAIFAVVALGFGVSLLGLWRLNSPIDNELSVMAVFGILSLFCGGYAGANELGLLSMFGDNDSDASGGDGGGD